MLDIARKELEEAAIDFYNMTKIKIVLYSDNKEVLYTYPETMCELCTTLRSAPEINNKCIECDNLGLEKSTEQKGLYIYKCHMGLTEATVPIYENSVTIGYLMLGQVIDRKNTDEALHLIKNACSKYGFDEESIEKQFGKVKIASAKMIKSAANIMSMCACYLYTNKIIKNRMDILAYQLKDYIDGHLSTDLSVKSLCSVFYISKSKLYYMAKTSLGMGVSDYIRTKRLELAKRMLSETNYPLFQIAHETGIDDANYFSRIFRQEFGMTPKEYRKVSGKVKN